jgi:hypothetical protein
MTENIRKLPPQAFKPGQSGNPAGRKKGSINFKTLMVELLNHQIDNPSGTFFRNKKKITASQALLIALYKKAIKGDVTAIREFFERADEVLPQTVNIVSRVPSPEDEIIIREFLNKQKMSENAGS